MSRSSNTIPSGLAPVNLSCEYTQNPLGVETPAPRLTWQLSSAQRGQRQTAYQVLVASSPELLASDRGDLWGTGKVVSDQCVHVPYGGAPLAARQRCYWKVRAWDRDGQPSDYSTPASWEMGLLHPEDWRAQWISTDNRKPPEGVTAPPSPMFRRVFNIERPVESARMYISGLGYYELRINGSKVGDHVLDPAFTRYDKRALYVTYDVTECLKPGDNAIGVITGNGWYNSHTKDVWLFEAAAWRSHLTKLLVQMHVEYADGGSDVFISDASWKWSTGPVIYDAVRNGETYDAREEKPGWDTASYDDSAWTPVRVLPGPGGVLHSQQMPPIRVTETIAPVAVTEPAPGLFVFDMGQNFAGWAQLRVSGPAGTTVTMRYAELLGPDGRIDVDRIKTLVYSGEFQTDHYTLKGGGEEVWEPRFTYHGFRYVEVTGFPGRPTPDNLRGRVVHTAFEKSGEFECSNDLLNKIQTCTLWSYRSNFHGYPTDCPHREKNGWTGDAHIAAETGLLNFDPASAYAKWLADFEDAQRPDGQLPSIIPTSGWGWWANTAWDSAYLLIPWYLYVYRGDLRILQMHYEGMKRVVDCLTGTATDHVVALGLGDWCPPKGDWADYETPLALTTTAYYYADTVILAEAAELLGKRQDAERYAALAEEIHKAFNKTFYDAKTGSYANGTQTGLACALYQGLAQPNEHGKIVAQLLKAIEARGGHLDCGILGTKYLLHVLTEHGRADVAYGIATKTDYPSWGHWIAQGATTLWETWSGGDSRNHIMFGDISAWFYRVLAGINPDPERPGFKHIIIRPHPVGDLTWARAEHRSMYGPIRSAWHIADDEFSLDVAIPANTTATIYMPAGSLDGVREGNTPAVRAQGVNSAKVERNCVMLEIGSGEYHFKTPS